MKNLYITSRTVLLNNSSILAFNRTMEFLLKNAQIINFPDANLKVRLLSADTNNSTAAIGWTGNSTTAWARIGTNYNFDIQNLN